MKVDPIQPAECDACGFPTAGLEHCEPLVQVANVPGTGRSAWLCYVCRRTPVLRAIAHHPAAFRDEHLLSTLGYLANLVLERLPPPFPDVAAPPDAHVLADCGVDEPT